MRLRRIIPYLAIGAGLMSAAAPSEALTVRVDPAGGAPRILVNGAPVRSRVFWGAPGSTPIPLKAEAREVTFDFTATGPADNGTMHFRFSQTPGTIVLDDIQVTDLDAKRDIVPLSKFEEGQESFTRDWTFWPTGEQNTVGAIEVVPGAGKDGSAGLRVTQKAPASGSWPDFHLYHKTNLPIVAGHNYRVRFWVKSDTARDLIVAFYRPGQSYTHIGGPAGGFESQIKLAAKAGVNLVSFPVDMPWPEPGKEVDWSSAELACRRVLAANPNALLIPRLSMNPPAWWVKAYPEDAMQWEDGSRANYGVPASPRYRRDAAERLAALVRHLEATLGDHIAGYHPGGQNTSEWFYQNSWGRLLNGYAPADLAGWRTWLKERYKTDAALQRAWGRANVTLDTVAVPTPAERHAAPAGIFRDPAAERHIIDWSQFQQEAMAGIVTTLAKAAREASGGKKLVLFFYGYVFEFGAIGTGPASAGHYALRNVLNSPDIDVLCSPISYFDRGLAESAPSMTAAESVALAGKLWLNEDDTHTYLATGTPPGYNQHVDTLEETNHELVRNTAQAAMRNFGCWWMDLTATGWFNDPGMWAEMVRLKPLDDALIEKPTPFRPEVAAVIDERSMLRVAEGGNAVTRPGIYEARRALGRMGAPYGQYLLDDLQQGKVKAKLYVLLNPWVLSEAQRTAVLAATRGATRLWCYAPGYFGESGPSIDAMKTLTGFTLKPVTPTGGMAAPTEQGRKLGLTQPFGVNNAVKPLFAATDAKPEEILATYPDGSAAVAMRRTGDGISLFVGAPGITSELMRLAARQAGVHLFTPDADCNVYANGPFVAVHASQDGPLELHTGKPGDITDMLTGQKVGVGPTLVLPIKRGETRVLRYGGGR